MLGLGHTLVPRESYARDVSLMLKAAYERKIPLIISSAGGAGTDAQVDFMIDLIRELSAANGYKFKLAAIYSSVDRAMIHARLREGRITECGPSGDLAPSTIDEAVEIVAQIGAEPFAKVLAERPDIDIIVSGRSYDPAPHAALCMVRGGIDPGTYWHMGKIVECGAACAEPKGRVIKATIRKDSFDLEPMNPAERCTPLSVAAHTLYEKSRPDILPGPGGALHLAGARYEALDDRRTRISGGVFVPTNKYSVKLEGAAIVGYRTMFVGGIRDPILIGQLDSYPRHHPQARRGHLPAARLGRGEPDVPRLWPRCGDGRDGADAPCRAARGRADGRGHRADAGARQRHLQQHARRRAAHALSGPDGDRRQLRHPAQSAGDADRAGLPVHASIT